MLSFRAATLRVMPFRLEIVSLSVASLVVGGVVTLILLSLSPSTSAGVKNNTKVVSDQYYTQITPADFGHYIWNVIILVQVLWLCYAWSFACRPKAKRTIAVSVYWLYAPANASSVAWLYLWGNYYIGGALVLLVATNVFLYASLGLLCFHFHRCFSSDFTKPSREDYWLTWIFAVNGIGLFATWTTALSFANVSAVLQYFAGLNATNSGTVSLVVLTVTIATYFVLENTIFDRFARYVLCVYPVVMWWLIAVLGAHWSQKNRGRNAIYTLVLLIVVIALAAVRIALIVKFTSLRPIHGNNRSTSKTDGTEMTEVHHGTVLK